MDRVNSANRGIDFMYQGKSGGVAKNTRDDVLTRRVGTFNDQPVGIFERVGAKTAWQKIRNFANGTQRATADDVKAFLTSRGMKANEAAEAVKNITMRSGAVSARGFEELINRQGLATESEQSLYTPTKG